MRWKVWKVVRLKPYGPKIEMIACYQHMYPSGATRGSGEGELAHRRDRSEATSAETPATITTARARLEPVPPKDEMLLMINKLSVIAVVDRVRFQGSVRGQSIPFQTTRMSPSAEHDHRTGIIVELKTSQDLPKRRSPSHDGWERKQGRAVNIAWTSGGWDPYPSGPFLRSSLRHRLLTLCDWFRDGSLV